MNADPAQNTKIKEGVSHHKPLQPCRDSLLRTENGHLDIQTGKHQSHTLSFRTTHFITRQTQTSYKTQSIRLRGDFAVNSLKGTVQPAVTSL